MKKILLIAGLIGFAAVGFACFRYSNDLKSGMAYVDRTVPKIIQPWDQNALNDESAMALLQRNKAHPEELEKLFQLYSSRLGTMKEYRGSSGISIFSFKRKSTDSRFFANVVFEKTPARVFLTLVKEGNAWKISDFAIAAKALANPH